jgi:hypothetical protein
MSLLSSLHTLAAEMRQAALDAAQDAAVSSPALTRARSLARGALGTGDEGVVSGSAATQAALEVVPLLVGFCQVTTFCCRQACTNQCFP